MARVKTPPVNSLINSGFVMPYPEIKKTTDKTSVSQTSTRLNFVKKRSCAFLICPVSLNLLSDFPDIKVFLNMRWKSVRDMRALSLLGRSLVSLARSSRLIRIYSMGISLWLFSRALLKFLMTICMSRMLTVPSLLMFAFGFRARRFLDECSMVSQPMLHVEDYDATARQLNTSHLNL